MPKDLTSSSIERQNVLNNPYAIEEIQKATHIKGVLFEGNVRLIKEQVAQFFEITPRTIDNLLQQYSNELRHNGYEVLKGKRLQEFKLCVQGQSANEMDFVTKTTILGIFDFRTFLNVAMLLSGSERARLLRQMILDIVIDTVNQRSGGGTKYINQRDEDFIHAYFQEENYRKDFTDALQDYVDMGKQTHCHLSGSPVSAA